MRVSEYYTLGITQPSLDFVDVRLDTDVPLFIDPTALNLLDTEWGAKCRSLIHEYFSLVLEHISNGEHSKARNLLAQLGEPNETHLGLSRRRSRGHGMGKGLADKMWQALNNSSAVRTGLITDLEDTALLIDGVASDVISDIVTNIIREPLLEYTIEMANQYGIPLETRQTRKLWDAQAKKWVVKDMLQAVTTVGNRPLRLMLVPKAIVRKSISYDAGEYYNKYLLEQLQEEQANQGLIRILKNGEHRPPTKKSIKEQYLDSDGKVNAKQQNRNLTPDRPDVLERFKQEVGENPKPTLSHAQISEELDTPLPDWDKLLNDLLEIQPGADEAKKYEKAVQALFDALFYPWLMFPQPQTRLNEGRKIVDITYTNVAQEDFFRWLKDNYPSAFIFVECKNYSTDIGNPEFDQLAGRFGPSKGKVGLLISRKIANKKLVQQSCRDTANDDRGFIIALDDDDIKSLVESVKTKPAGERLDLLRERFNKLVL
jgi:hypothetical protein